MIFFGSWTFAPVLATNWGFAGKSALHGKRRALFLAMTTNGAPYGCLGKDGGIRLASFAHDDPGYFDLEQKTLQSLDSPFGSRLSPMSWVRSVTYVCGLDGERSGGERGSHSTLKLLGFFFVLEIYPQSYPMPADKSASKKREPENARCLLVPR